MVVLPDLLEPLDELLEELPLLEPSEELLPVRPLLEVPELELLPLGRLTLLLESLRPLLVVPVRPLLELLELELLPLGRLTLLEPLLELLPLGRVVEPLSLGRVVAEPLFELFPLGRVVALPLLLTLAPLPALLELMLPGVLPP